MKQSRLKALRIQFEIIDFLSNFRCFHRVVLNKKIYLGVAIISLSLANSSCHSDSKKTKDKKSDKKDLTNFNCKRDSSTIRNEKSDSSTFFSDSLITTTSCYVPTIHLENKDNNEISLMKTKKDSNTQTINNKQNIFSELTNSVTNIEMSSCYDISHFSKNEPEIYTITEEMPQFVGGDNALKKYIDTNLVWPKEAQEWEGTVYISFIIDTSGKPTDISVRRGLQPLIDKGAIRLVKNMPLWIPGKQSGKVVNVQYTLPIKFIRK